MKKNYSHKLILEIGLDLTEYLSPQNLNGVKAYLGVDNDVDVVAAIGEDKYRRIESLLIPKGINVIGATMTNMQNEIEDQSIDAHGSTEEAVPKTKLPEADNVDDSIEDGVTQGEKRVLDFIKNAKDQIGDTGVITEIIINKGYEGQINSVEMLKNVSEIFSDTGIKFEAMDHELIVNYMDTNANIQTIIFD
ncbi:hypothetical protein [Lactobacillus taiwanensis]|uniref:hypothetical protein n=1 Tax=Lactobacillus taiwanensis TaxID=508451 RepID=UPI0032205D1C